MKNVLLGLLCMFAVNLTMANTIKVADLIPLEAIENYAPEVFDTSSNVVISYSMVNEMKPSCSVTVTFDNGCGSSGTFTVSADTCAHAMAAANLVLSFIPDC